MSASIASVKWNATCDDARPTSRCTRDEYHVELSCNDIRSMILTLDFSLPKIISLV